MFRFLGKVVATGSVFLTGNKIYADEADEHYQGSFNLTDYLNEHSECGNEWNNFWNYISNPDNIEAIQNAQESGNDEQVHNISQQIQQHIVPFKQCYHRTGLDETLTKTVFDNIWERTFEEEDED